MRALTVRVSLVLTVCACGDPNAPADAVAGRYALQSVDGQPLPWDPGVSGSAVLVADTIAFAHDGTWTEARWTAATADGSATRAPGFGTWALEGTTLRVQHPLVSSSDAAVTTYDVGAGGREFTTVSGRVMRPIERFVRLP